MSRSAPRPKPTHLLPQAINQRVSQKGGFPDLVSPFVFFAVFGIFLFLGGGGCTSMLRPVAQVTNSLGDAQADPALAEIEKGSSLPSTERGKCSSQATLH